MNMTNYCHVHFVIMRWMIQIKKISYLCIEQLFYLLKKYRNNNERNYIFKGE
jgi:hypothetical protein